MSNEDGKISIIIICHRQFIRVVYSCKFVLRSLQEKDQRISLPYSEISF